MAASEVDLNHPWITQELRDSLFRLEDLKRVAPDAVNDFLQSLSSLSDLIAVSGEARVAEPANELVLTFKPSQRLKDFLAARAAGDDKSDVAQRRA